MSMKWCDIEIERIKALPNWTEHIQEFLAVIRKREAERFPDGRAASFATPLTPEQIARIRELKDVPIDKLCLDDKFDRQTFLAQWYSVLCRDHPFYRERLAAHLAGGGEEWAFWHDVARNTVNSVPPEDFCFRGKT